MNFAFIRETAQETRELDAEEAGTGPPISTYTTTLAASGSGAALLDTANRPPPLPYVPHPFPPFHPPFSTAPNLWPVAAGAGVVHQRGALAAAAAASPLLRPPEASVAAAGSVRGRRCCFPAGVGGLRCSFSPRPQEPPVAGKISSLLLLFFSIHIISHQLVSVFRGGLQRSRTIWQAKHGGASEPQEKLSRAKQELEHFTQEQLSKQQYFNTPHVMVIGSAGGRTSNLL